jgi:hypothetical protein
MIHETVPNRPLPVGASVRVAGTRSGAKQAALELTPFYLAGRMLFLHARSRFARSEVIPPHLDGALTGLASKEQNLTTAQRSVQLTPRYTSTRFRSDYPIAANIFLGISCPTVDELKDRMVLPGWGELRSSRSGRETTGLPVLEDGPLLKKTHQVRGLQGSR